MARSNMEYIENLYSDYRKNPEQVDPLWQKFFEGLEFSQSFGTAATSASPTEDSFSKKELGVYNLIQFYRDYGHLKADLDPLKIQKPQTEAFSLENFDLSESDLEQIFHVGTALGLGETNLRQILSRLEESYCGTLTAQLAECPPDVRKWFRREFEEQVKPTLSVEKRRKFIVNWRGQRPSKNLYIPGTLEPRGSRLKEGMLSFPCLRSLQPTAPHWDLKK